jgi:hypothetical protein
MGKQNGKPGRDPISEGGVSRIDHRRRAPLPEKANGHEKIQWKKTKEKNKIIGILLSITIYLCLAFLTLMVISLLSRACAGATVTSVDSGQWTNAAVWDAGVPGDNDDVIISENDTVWLTQDDTCDEFTILVNGTLYTNNFNFTSHDYTTINGTFQGNNSATVNHETELYVWTGNYYCTNGTTTVTNWTTCYGNMNAYAGTLNLGLSGTCSYGYNSAGWPATGLIGRFDGGTGAHNIASIFIGDYGYYNFTTGVTTLNRAGTYVLYNDWYGEMGFRTGIVKITATTQCQIWVRDNRLNTLIIETGADPTIAAGTLYIDGDFIVNGTFRVNDKSIIVAGTTWVSGYLDSGPATWDHQKFATIYVNASGTWNLTQMQTTITTLLDVDASATVNHNDGRVNIHSTCSMYGGNQTFYDLWLNDTCDIYESYKCENYSYVYHDTLFHGDIYLTYGSNTQNGTFQRAGVPNVEAGTKIYLYALSESYYVRCRPSHFESHDGTDTHIIRYKWVYFIDDWSARGYVYADGNISVNDGVICRAGSVIHEMHWGGHNITVGGYIRNTDGEETVFTEFYPEWATVIYDGDSGKSSAASLKYTEGNWIYNFTEIRFTNGGGGGVTRQTIWTTDVISGTPTYYHTINVNSINFTAGPRRVTLQLKGGGTINLRTATGIRRSLTSLYNVASFRGMSNANLLNITGPPNWYINATEHPYYFVPWESDYEFLYVNVSNSYNYGLDYNTTYITAGASVNFTGNTGWDFVAPIVTIDNPTEGLVIDKTLDDTLDMNITAQDLSFIWNISYMIDCLDNGTKMAYNDTDYFDYGFLHQYTWYEQLGTPPYTVDPGPPPTPTYYPDFSDYLPGQYRLHVNASDSHNPATSWQGKKNAQDMLCEIADKKAGKKVKDRKLDGINDNIINFTRASTGEWIYSIKFLGVGKNGVKHYINWTSENNFKLEHEVDLPKESSTVTLRFTAQRIIYLRDSSYYVHLLIGDNPRYFYDADDFYALGGRCFVKVHNKTTVDVTYSHYLWREGKKTFPKIDPLSGACNVAFSQTNFSVGCSVSLVSPSNNSYVEGLTYAKLNVTVNGIGAFPAVVNFYNNKTGAHLKRRTISDGGFANFNWTGLQFYRTYQWHCTCLVNGVNITGPWWTFTTRTYFNLTVLDFTSHLPVESANITIYSENGTLVYENITDVNGQCLSIILTPDSLPIEIQAHYFGNWVQIQVWNVTGDNITLYLYLYSVNLQINLKVVNNFTLEIVPLGAILHVMMNNNIYHVEDWISYPINYAHFKIYDQFDRKVWDHNYTGLSWGGVPYNVTAYINYAEIEIQQQGANETFGTWVLEWSIAPADMYGEKYYFYGKTIKVVCINLSDDFILEWNDTSQVEGGQSTINDVGHTISSKSPHSSGGMIAYVRMSMKPVGVSESGLTQYLPESLNNMIDWFVRNIMKTNLYLFVGGILFLFFIVLKASDIGDKLRRKK